MTIEATGGTRRDFLYIVTGAAAAIGTLAAAVPMIDQMELMNNTTIIMGQSFDISKNDDFFYLPPEAFGNPDFQTGLRMFLSPDGRSARFFITHEGDPATYLYVLGTGWVKILSVTSDGHERVLALRGQGDIVG